MNNGMPENISDHIFLAIPIIFQIIETRIIGILLNLFFGHGLIGDGQVSEKGV